MSEHALDLPSRQEIADELSGRGLPSRLVDPLARRLSKEPKEPITTKTGLKDHVAAVMRKVDGQLEQGERLQLLHYTDQIVAVMTELSHPAPTKPAKVEKTKDDEDKPKDADDPMSEAGKPPVSETS